MGTICILLGLIIFCVFALVGCFAATSFVNMWEQMFALPNKDMVTALIIAVCVFIGFLICISLVMHGLTYNKVCKLSKEVKQLKARGRFEEKDEEAFEDIDD